MRRRSDADGSYGSRVALRLPGMTALEAVLHLQPLAFRIVERFQTRPRRHLLVGDLDLELRAVDQRLVDALPVLHIAHADRARFREAVAGGGDIAGVATIHENGFVV